MQDSTPEADNAAELALEVTECIESETNSQEALELVQLLNQPHFQVELQTIIALVDEMHAWT